MEKIKEFLSKNKIEFAEDFDLLQISSIKIGQIAKIVIFPKNEKQLENLVLWFFAKKIYFKIIGNASNVLFESNISYPLIITTKMEQEINIAGRKVTVSAGMLISKFSEILKNNCLSGFEGLVNIPATIGGAIVCGAGAFGDNIYDHLVSIKVFENGKIFNIKRENINFKHHYSNLFGIIVLSATFLFEKRNEYDIIKSLNEFAYLRAKSQPASLSLGSVFQKINGKSAGFYIERSGLKGVRVGGISISNKHANFFVNDGTGTALDFLRLYSIVKSAVEANFGLGLMPEIERVGEKHETDSRLSHTFEKL